ncbi:hypothetical protein BH18ACI3_BH18ACI3_08820 [soil metagenome]
MRGEYKSMLIKMQQNLMIGVILGGEMYICAFGTLID